MLAPVTQTAVRPPLALLPPAHLFARHVKLTMALALLPSLRVWKLTADPVAALTTLGLFAAAAGLIWRLTPAELPRSHRGARVAAGLMLAATAWQWAWIDGCDFWFCRLAFVIWAMAWLLIWWGVPGFLLGWRVIAAFVIWGLWCEAPWHWMRGFFESGDRFGPALAAATARVSGWLLAAAGTRPTVLGNAVLVHGRSVPVLVPSTALPVAKYLILLLTLATLLFRLPWLRAIALAAAALLLAFGVSVVRFALVALLAHDPGRVRFWAEPGSGGPWLVALAAAVLGLWFVRALPPAPAPAWPGGTAHATKAGRWVLMGSIAALALATVHPIPRLQSWFDAVPPPGFRVTSDRSADLDLGPAGTTHPNEPAWVRSILYVDTAQGRRLELTLAYVPVMLAGDLRPEAGDWTIDPTGRYAAHRQAGQTVWVTTYAQGGAAFATADGWSHEVDRGLTSPRRWARWWAHRGPLRDKRAYWVEAALNGPGAGALPGPPAPFSTWLARRPPAGE